MTKQEKYDNYYMRIAREVSCMSQCLNRHVGAVIVSCNGSIIATGTNGNMPHTPHCNETGVCTRRHALDEDGTWKFQSARNLNLCLAVHAEQNALMQACKNGVSTLGARLYCTTFPCSQCLKLLVSAGITRVCYSQEYKDELYDTMMNLLKGKIVFDRIDLNDRPNVQEHFVSPYVDKRDI